MNFKTTLFTVFLLFSSLVLHSQSDLQITDNTVIKNEAGELLTIEEMQELLQNSNYTLDPIKVQDGVLEELLIRRMSAMEMDPSSVLGASGSLEGKLAIPFVARDLNDNKYDLKILKNKVAVLKFWFIDCQPCLQEIPELNDLVHQFKDEDVVFLGFALDEKAQLEAFLTQVDFDYNIIPDANIIRSEYGVVGFPTHIVIGKNGQVKKHIQGSNPQLRRDLTIAIERELFGHSVSYELEKEEEGQIEMVLSPDMTFKDEAGNEIDFDSFIALMETGSYQPEKIVEPSGEEYIRIKKL